VALDKASGALGWLWALGLLLVAVLRHLAGESPIAASPRIASAGPACAHGEFHDEGAAAVPQRHEAVSADVAGQDAGKADAGKAWAEKEERRFRQPRCC
jgi:hypothetical protein